jgi:uncharacterized repeat protein (TIGR03847 family)
MPRIDLELKPVTYITVDAIGQPGERIFYLQGSDGTQVATLLIEKIQMQSVAVGAQQFLAELLEKFPDLTATSPDFDEEKMHIHPPVDPLFRVGEIGLGYQPEDDRVILIAREIMNDVQTEDDVSVVHYWCTRSQLHAASQWALEVAGRGRPVCPQCGEPMEPSGHLCPKKNGHKH